MKKIMFNDRYGLTAAVLSGKKTMTRRMISQEFFSLAWDVRDDTLVYENDFGDFIDIRKSKYARYKVGEVVAVAQAYKHCINDILIKFGYKTDIAAMVYSKLAGWTNKMFVRAYLMQHRIRITDVRVERLQDISDEDCINEGIENLPYSGLGRLKPYAFYDTSICTPGGKGWYVDFDTPRKAFAALIDKVSGKGTWERNPWVFVYEFELLK